MRERIILLFIITMLLQAYTSVFSQENSKIVLSASQSVKFLQQRFQSQNWIDTDDPFRQALGRLIYEASNLPYDSTEHFLRSYPYDSLSIPSVTGLKDTTIMVAVDTIDRVGSSYSGFPFRYFSFPFQGDSIEVAVKELLKYLEERDSTIIYFSGAGKRVTPVWLNSRLGMMTRFWLRNEYSDSVTVWIGNPSRDTVNLYLEQGVNFTRPVRQGNYAGAKINIQSLDKSRLLEIKKIFIKPQYWKYRSEASFILSQAALTNWVRGGENSISTSMDITGYADYNNKPLKLSSNTFARIKLGFLASGDNPIRKNLDLLETNSKLNQRAFG
jgi:hypothetical protein